MTRVLVIDDDPAILDNVLDLLAAEGFEGIGATNGKAGLASALAKVPELVICDIGMPVMDGHQVLKALRDYPETSSVPFIFLTARASRSEMREGMNLGADDYLTKPFAMRELLDAIRSRLDRHQAIATASPSIGALAGSGDSQPIVCSDALRAVWDEALLAARSDLAILLLGETGVGKDVLAHAIHKASPRNDGPFVPLNSVALPDSLLESELFGHEKGTFTGATGRREGLFETAHGGTVFLDEIGELPLDTQVTLLRVLEDRRVMRVGGRQFIEVDVRFVSATNQDLAGAARDGRFRSDLFYRIAGITLTVPPLRERPADIAPLAERFALGMSQRMGRTEPPRLSAATLQALEAWSWPGNVRELRNTVERCVALSADTEIGPEVLPQPLRGGVRGGTPSHAIDGRHAQNDLPADVRRRQRELEKQRILDALDAHGGNQTRAAKTLGISRRTLINRLDEFELPRPRK